MGRAIIVIEGTDGSGKKTQTQLLLKNLEKDGYDVVSHSFPSYQSPSSGPVKLYLSGALGSEANSISPKQASVLFAADRVATYLNIENGFKKFLDEGKIVLLDRYVYSNMIHQACKLSSEKEVDSFLDWVCDLEFESLSLPKANLIFFLDMPTEKSLLLAQSRGELKAGTKKDIHEQDEKHLERAYNTAKYVATKFGWTQISCLNKFGQLKTIEEISNEIYNITKNFLENKKTEE